jgi:hypothetical protein
LPVADADPRPGGDVSRGAVHHFSGAAAAVQNEPGFTLAELESLRSGAQVVVVDGASTDDTVTDPTS